MRRLVLSAAVSLLTLGLIFQLVAQGAGRDAELWPLLRDVVPLLLVGYILCQVAQTAFRSERYRLLLYGAGEMQVPSAGHSFLATLARNALVDLLPARAGELGYLALMNRNYRVGADTCLGSMAISLLFDFIALAAVLALAIAAPWTHGVATWPLLLQGLAALSLVSLLGIWGLLVLLPKYIIPLWQRLRQSVPRLIPRRAGEFIDRTMVAVARVRQRRLLLIAFLYSLGVRFFKYLGLLLLFRGVTRIHLPALALAEARQVLPTLLAGEGAAALPLPTLMGFGAYEGGATGVWTLLGYPAAAAFLAMLALHIVSQAVDYTLGGAAFVVIAWSSGRGVTERSGHGRKRGRDWAVAAVVGALLLGAALFALYEWRDLRKRGSLTPPAMGAAVVATSLEQAACNSLLARYHGRLVWSSNRFGNHDILMMEWPSAEIKRLTRHPHTETYPRLSPDGQRLLFARAQTAWVSQRNSGAWDTWLLDLKSGREECVATNSFFASWAGENAILFQRRDDLEVVRLDLQNGQEELLLLSGKDPIPAGATLQTADYRTADGALAITLRGKQRITAWIDKTQRLHQIGAGDSCQATWGLGDELLYIGSGGRMKNAIYRHDIRSGKSELWLDLPGEWSHEYFPRLDATGRLLVFAASAGGHEHDTADYEIFAWEPGKAASEAVRLTFHSGNDCWPDIWLQKQQ